MLNEGIDIQTSGWELSSINEIEPPGGNLLRKRQFSLKWLLIAMCVLGVGLGVVVRVARWIKTGTTPVRWQWLSVAKIDALALEKRCVVLTGYDGGWTTFDESLRQTDTSWTRLALERFSCTAYVINSTSNHATLMALKKRFPAAGFGGDGDFRVLLIENGEAVKWFSTRRFSFSFDLERICAEERSRATGR